MGRKVNKLSDLDIDEVSLVDRGANQHAQVLIHKRDEDASDSEPQATDGEFDKASPSSHDVHVEGGEAEAPDDDEYEDDTELEEGKSKTKKGFFSSLVDKVLGGESEEFEKVNPGMQIPYGQMPQAQPGFGPQGAMPGAPPGMPQMGAPQGFPAGPGQMPGQMQAGPPLPQEVIDYIQQLEQALAQAQGKDEMSPNDEEDDVNFGKSAEDLSSDEIDFLQELAKNLEDDDLRESVNKALDAVNAANARAEQAEKIAKAEQDHRLTQEYVAKAQKWVNLPVDSTEFGPVLKRLHETMDDDDVAVIEKALSAANESLATAGIFTEIGKKGSAGFSVVSKVDGEANSLIEKSEGSMTKEQAVAKVLEDNPHLYDDYLSETGTGRF